MTQTRNFRVTGGGAAPFLNFECRQPEPSVEPGRQFLCGPGLQHDQALRQLQRFPRFGRLVDVAVDVGPGQRHHQGLAGGEGADQDGCARVQREHASAAVGDHCTEMPTVARGTQERGPAQRRVPVAVARAGPAGVTSAILHSLD